MGIVTLYFQHLGRTGVTPVVPNFGVIYLSIPASLNILLTLMIVVRLVMHGRNLRAVTSSSVGISGLYKAASTIFIESCALLAVSSLAVVIALSTTRSSDDPDVYWPGSYVVDITFPVLAEIQVRAYP